MKKLSILGIMMLFVLTSWGQGYPFSPKKSKFQAPRFYVLLGQDSVSQPPTASELPMPLEEEENEGVQEEARPTEISVIVSTDSAYTTAQNQKMDSLLGQMALVRAQLQELQAAHEQAVQEAAMYKARPDTIYQVDSLRVMMPTATETVARSPEKDYSTQFLQLNQQLDSLQIYMKMWELKMDNSLRDMAGTPPTQPVETAPVKVEEKPQTLTTPAVKEVEKSQPVASNKEPLIDPKLLSQVAKQNEQIEAIEKKMDRYAVNHADGIADLRKSNLEIKNRLDNLLLAQTLNSATQPSQPAQVEVIVPKDSSMSRQLAEIKAQLAVASRQDAGGRMQGESGRDSLLLQQFDLMSRQMAVIESEQQALRVSNARLRQQKDSLTTKLAARPKVLRDTVLQTRTQTQIKTDTLRLKTEVLGLQKTNIYFKKGSADLFDADLPVLEKLAEQLLAHPDLKLYLRGYADNLSGSAATNLRLSGERAQQLKDFFLKKGVDEKRLIVESYGSQNSIYKNSLDRRVELEVKAEK